MKNTMKEKNRKSFSLRSFILYLFVFVLTYTIATVLLYGRSFLSYAYVNNYNEQNFRQQAFIYVKNYLAATNQDHPPIEELKKKYLVIDTASYKLNFPSIEGDFITFYISESGEVETCYFDYSLENEDQCYR